MRMALLASCWLLVESFILPNGLVKWFFLSISINPFFLFFCQIFLWLKKFQNFICYVFGISCFISSLIIIYIKKVVLIFVSLVTPTKLEAFHEGMDHDFQSINSVIVMKSLSISGLQNGDSIVSTWHDSSQKVEVKDGDEEFQNSWLQEYLTSDQYNNSTPFSSEPDMNSYESQSSSLSSSFMDQEFQSKMESFDDVVNNMVDVLPKFAEIQQFVEGMHPAPSAPPTISTKGINDFMLSDMLRDSCINGEFTRGVEDSAINSFMKDAEVDYEYLLAVCRSDLSILSSEQARLEGNRDSFHHMYTKRMRFYDVLYQERSYGINAICDADIASPRSMTSIASQNSIEVQAQMLLKSLKSDLELVYTAEACLTWDALHDSYRKVETLAHSDSSQCFPQFFINVSVNFQKFQVLFERFLEDQRLSDGKSSPSHVIYRRCQLQVPDVTGFLEDENCDLRGEMNGNEALKAIEKCIRSFWTYIKTDSKNFSWKLKVSLWSRATVEDPKDLQLFYELTKALQKNEQVVKDLQRKNQSLLKRRVKPVQVECESIDVLCCAIELKLVKKVLEMQMVSTNHLKWCQEKLNNMELRDGQLYRGTGTYLFPFS